MKEKPMQMGRFLILALLIVFLSSCGTMVMVEKAPQKGLVAPDAKRVLIFPFPSYEPMKPESWLALNVNLFENLAESFYARGFDPLPFESVLSILQEEDILVMRTPRTQVHSSLRLVLEEPDWSPLMKEEIAHIINRQNKVSVRLDWHKWSAFSEEKLLEIAEEKGVDFLVCGRISRYRLRPEETFNPFQIGFLTFLTRVPARFLYGAPQEGYDLWQQVGMGALWGGLFGADAQDPFEPPVYRPSAEGHPLFSSTMKKVRGDSHYETGNTIVWGLVGAGLGYLAAHGGNAPEAALALSLTVYDVKAGHKVWVGRVKLKVVPESVFAPHRQDKLFERALEEAVAQLMTRFWQDYESPHLASIMP